MTIKTPRHYRRAEALRPAFYALTRTPPLTRDQEHALARRVADGDPEARDQMIRANLRLVVMIARRCTGSGLDFEDRVAEGSLGLVRAVEGFDPSVGVRFSTYATYWIKQAIRNAGHKQALFVRLPAYAHTLLARWSRAAAALAERHGRPVTDEEVGRALRLRPKKLRLAEQIRRARALTRHYPEVADPDAGQAAGFDDCDDGRPGVEQALELAEALEQLRVQLARLEPRDAEILRLRFGLDGAVPQTLAQIGRALGLTRERVRQRAQAALLQLEPAACGH